MKLSFVIPAYNEEHFLGNCLGSIFEVMKETSYTYEVIVVNNNSSDTTRRIAEQFPVVIVDEPRQGLSYARQAGFLAAAGELIANVDADTVLPNGWIKKVFFEFEQNPRLVALSGPHVFYDVPKKILLWQKLFYCVGYVAYFFNRHIFRVSSLIQGGNNVVRRSALDSIGGYDVSFKFYGEDADLAHRLHKIGDVKFTMSLPIFASGRRVIAEGKFKVAFRYIGNYLSTIFLRRPVSTDSSAVRPNSPPRS